MAFAKGHTSAQKGKIGEENHRWLGVEAKYAAKHNWLQKHYRHPVVCEECGVKGKEDSLGRWDIQWANISGLYLREVTDYRPLCIKCHARFDLTTECKKGHVRTGENNYVKRDGTRVCNPCKRLWQIDYRRNINI
jgi:hypothetical protein